MMHGYLWRSNMAPTHSAHKNDAILLPQAGGDQRQRFTGSSDVTLIAMTATGHILRRLLISKCFKAG